MLDLVIYELSYLVAYSTYITKHRNETDMANNKELTRPENAMYYGINRKLMQS